MVTRAYKKKTAEEIRQKLTDGKFKKPKGAFISITNSDISDSDKEKLRDEVRKHFNLSTPSQEQEEKVKKKKGAKMVKKAKQEKVVKVVLPEEVEEIEEEIEETEEAEPLEVRLPTIRIPQSSRAFTLLQIVSNGEIREIITRLLDQSISADISLIELQADIRYLAKMFKDL